MSDTQEAELRRTDRGTWRLVARRDFWVRLRDRGFVISTVITLAVLSVFIVLRANNLGSTPSYDLGGIEGADIAERTAAVGAEAGIGVTVHTYPTEVSAETAVRDGEVDAAVVGEELVGRSGVPRQLGQLVQAAAIAGRLAATLDEYGVPVEEQAALADRTPVEVRSLEPTDPRTGRRTARTPSSGCCCSTGSSSATASGSPPA